jgi:hypothetical protein
MKKKKEKKRKSSNVLKIWLCLGKNNLSKHSKLQDFTNVFNRITTKNSQN